MFILNNIWKNSSYHFKKILRRKFWLIHHIKIKFNLKNDRFVTAKSKIIHDSISKNSKIVIKNLFNNVWIYLHMKITNFRKKNRRHTWMMTQSLTYNFFSLQVRPHTKVYWLYCSRVSSHLYMFVEMFLIMNEELLNVGWDTCQNIPSPSCLDIKKCTKLFSSFSHFFWNIIVFLQIWSQ